MKRRLTLGDIVVEHTDGVPTCVRRLSDPPECSSLHPTIEAALLDSDVVITACIVDDATGDPQELDFG